MKKFKTLNSVILAALMLFSRGYFIQKAFCGGTVRRPVVSGRFYPSDARALRIMIENFLEKAAPSKLEGELIGLVVPHAGYRYSGEIAAWGYKLLEEKEFETVVILGPSHYLHYQGSSVYNIGDYRTPLGVVKVNKGLSDKIIAENKQITYYAPLHQKEHSVEVEVPFLQVVLNNFSIIPVVIGDKKMAICRGLADALTKVLKGKKILFIASSDMSHYYEYATANLIDEKTLRAIERFSPDELSDKLNSGDVELCGGAAIITVMIAAKKFGADKVKVLKYANSGDTSGEKKSVVGYAAIAFYRSSKKPPASLE
ncbi:MAG: AmmeMemoRadiSam system protein B [Candidatus Omnitrophota bacterium]|nr:AmmeMemoRadiSam system protein B [Candidatus Omnitrophota bacterium]